MHSCEASGSPVVPTVPPQSGPGLLLQLGRLIVRSRSPANVDRPKTKLASPSTSPHILTQPRPEEPTAPPALESALANHVQALWAEQIPICIEVLLAPDCQDCYATLNRVDAEATYDKSHAQQRGLLLERWTMRALVNKSHEGQAFITSQWLLNAVRSQLHFSQLSAWLQRLRCLENPTERRRKLSREKCNYKKIESNCDDGTNERNLNIIYSIKIPGESYRVSEFSRPPADHVFPVTDIGNNIYLKVNLESLPRIEGIPSVKCFCPKRRPSISDDLVVKLNDLTLSSKYQDLGNCSRRLSIIGSPDTTEYLFSTSEQSARGKKTEILDDRMHTPCSENGKHKCNCDDESDFSKDLNLNIKETKMDDRRLKEIAKYKRRLRKEIKMKKLSDSTSSDGEGVKVKETRTSIPILQAARFDRFRAIGCYRNQTYLTLPASRIETRSPFIDSNITPPVEIKRTATMGTQTDDVACQCGARINFKCDSCRTIVRSEGNYDLSSVAKENIDESQTSEKCMEVNARGEENGVRRDGQSAMVKKLKCDILSSNLKCDKDIVNNMVDNSCSVKDFINENININNININRDEELIRRPKLRRLFPIVDRIERLVTDRMRERDGDREKEMEQLHLMDDDTVFCKTPIKPDTRNSGSHYSESYESNINITPNCPNFKALNTGKANMNNTDVDVRKPEAKRQKTFSINEDDFVTYEKCEFGTYDRCEIDSPSENDHGFQFPDPKIIPNKMDVKNHQHVREINIGKTRNQKSAFDCNYISKLDPIEIRRRKIQFRNNFNDTSSPNGQEKHHSSYQTTNNSQNDLIKNHTIPLNIQNQNLSNQKLSFLNFPTNIYQKYLGNQHTEDLDMENQYPGIQNNLKKDSSKYKHQVAQYAQVSDKKDQYSKDPDTTDSQLDERPSQSEDIHTQKGTDAQVPSPTEMDRFRWRFDSAASMVFHTKTGLPLTSSPAPLRRGNNCFDFDDSINGISGIKSALFHPYCEVPLVPASPPAAVQPLSPPSPAPPLPPHITPLPPRLRIGPSAGLLGTFEESALKGRLEPVATVHGFTAELGASGAFCPAHKRLPVTVFFYAPGGTNAPYLAHINLGTGYRVPSSGTVQVSLFNPHGTLVKMFVVLYDLTSMPACARTFLRQRTVYMPACVPACEEPKELQHKWLRYLIHLRFMTSKSGKLYLHTDIRILVSRKADLDTATAHSALFRTTNHSPAAAQPTNRNQANDPMKKTTNDSAGTSTNRGPNRVFGGCSEFDSEIQMCNGAKSPEISYEGQGMSYELRSFTYAPDNPKYSPR